MDVTHQAIERIGGWMPWRVYAYVKMAFLNNVVCL